VFVEPKTARSRRTVHLTPIGIDALLEQSLWQRQQSQRRANWEQSGLVFTSLSGGPLEPGVVNGTLSRLLLEADLPHVRVHDLRHTTASTLLEAGVHPKLVQDLLGHSTIAVTLDTYSHVTPALHDQAVHEQQRLLVRASPAVATASTVAR
jgi:integrase